MRVAEGRPPGRRRIVGTLGPRVCLALLFAFTGTAAQADARIDYILQCAGCHRLDGSGLPPEIPSLRDTPGRMVATAAGREYLVRVPGAAQSPLNDAELTAVTNWILREFSAATLPAGFRPLTVGEVAKSRRNVLSNPYSFRAEHWP